MLHHTINLSFRRRSPLFFFLFSLGAHDISCLLSHFPNFGIMAAPISSTPTLTNADLDLPYDITFTQNVQPYQIAVHEDFLDLTRAKINLTRFVKEDFDDPAAKDGPEIHSAREIGEYWAKEYDWRKLEAAINSTLQQFTCIVNPTESPANYSHQVPLHFVYHRSPRSDAIPLIFVHGWPGSFLEVASIINSLTNPPNPDLPAFHVVAPSIPGYGFSPAQRHPGFGYRAAAAAFHALMTTKLGYERYCFQGGDAGDFINRYAAHDFPSSVIAGHSNFWVVPPPPSDHPSFNNEEAEDAKAAAVGLKAFFDRRWAYGQIQQTRPLKLAHGLTDSPIGLAMWIYSAVVACIEPERVAEVWTLERVVTWTMMHWMNGPYGALSLYRWGAEVSRQFLVH